MSIRTALTRREMSAVRSIQHMSVPPLTPWVLPASRRHVGGMAPADAFTPMRRMDKK